MAGISSDGIVNGQQTYDTYTNPKTGDVVTTKAGDPIYYTYTWNDKTSTWVKGGAAPKDFDSKSTDIDIGLLGSLSTDSGYEDIKSYSNQYFASDAELNSIISNTKDYTPAAIATAKALKAANTAKFRTDATARFKAAGITVNSKGFTNVGGLPNLTALADKLQSQDIPTPQEVIQTNTQGLSSALAAGYKLESQYAPELARLTGQAQREQALKNIQFTLDSPQINAIRNKTEASRSNAEKALLAENDAKYADKSAIELSAMADAVFNQRAQEAKAAQFSALLPQYRNTLLEQMPGSKQTLESLGALGQQMAAQAAIRPELTAFEKQVAGPQLNSTLGTIDQNLLNQYMATMPGVVEGAQRLGQQANLDLAAGRSLTPEQERLATQAAREAYAARGMSLGPQAITSEVLNREELANQRYLQRQASAQQALGTIANLYQPGLAQTYARQAGAEQYGLGAQQQAFTQALARSDAEVARIQAANTLQANAANIAASSLGVQQNVLSPILTSYFNVPPAQGAYQTSVNQAQNQYAQAGLNVANPLNPNLTGLTMLPYQAATSNVTQRLNLASGFAQGYGK